MQCATVRCSLYQQQFRKRMPLVVIKLILLFNFRSHSEFHSCADQNNKWESTNLLRSQPARQIELAHWERTVNINWLCNYRVKLNPYSHLSRQSTMAVFRIDYIPWSPQQKNKYYVECMKKVYVDEIWLKQINRINSVYKLVMYFYICFSYNPYSYLNIQNDVKLYYWGTIVELSV